MSSEVTYCRPEKVYVASLVKRLFGLLPRKHKKQLFDSYSEESNILVWSYLDMNSLELDIKNNVIPSALSVVKKNTDNFLSDPTSNEKYRTMVSNYYKINVYLIVDNKIKITIFPFVLNILNIISDLLSTIHIAIFVDCVFL